MFPQPLFHIFGLSVNLYILLYVLGFIAALLLAIHLGREQSLPTDEILLIGIICAAAAGLGGAVLSGIINKLFNNIVPPISSLAWVVAVILTLNLYLALLPSMRGRIPQILDIVFPSIALGMVFGRLGCFSAGCCYGKPAEGLLWAVTFGASHSSAGIPLHPTQLYEAAGMLAILALLLGLRKIPAFKGALMWVYLAAYGLLRFVIEFYRGDPRAMVGSFSLAQVICAAFIAIGGAMVLRKIRSRGANGSELGRRSKE